VGDSDRIRKRPEKRSRQGSSRFEPRNAAAAASRQDARRNYLRISVPDAGPAHRHAAQTCRPYVALLCRERLAPNLSYDRNWGNATLLPDGEVLFTGGSAVDNQLTNVAYKAEIIIRFRELGRSAHAPPRVPKSPRLYHSAALLLPDGSVLTGGGGAPGPINELNAEIYYPAYLYDSSGNPAPRPTIVNAPGRLILGQNFWMTVATTIRLALSTSFEWGSTPIRSIRSSG
jgi:hypothetical protein